MRIARDELPSPRTADFNLRDFFRSMLKGAADNAMWISYGLFTVIALIVIAKDSATAGSSLASGAPSTLISEWSDAELSIPPIRADPAAGIPLPVSFCGDPAQSMELLESAPPSAQCPGSHLTQTVSAVTQ